MSKKLCLSGIAAGLLGCWTLATANAQVSPSMQRGAAAAGAQADERYVQSFLSHDPEEPGNQVRIIRQRASTRRRSLFSSLCPQFHQRADWVQQRLDDRYGFKTGLAFNSAMQGLSESLPGEDQFGMATDMDFIIDWQILNRGQPNRGRVVFGLEGRWEYGPPGPTDLGPASLGSAITTANTYAAYNPTYIVRNLYWKQGSAEAGWAYRIGHITPDQIFSTSSRLSPITTFLPVAGTGSFANALPDSGLGAVVGWAPNDRLRIGGVVSDANANRLRWAVGDGELYKALEIQAKLFPLTEKGVWSKVTVWHNDGTSDGQPINGSTGREGWGVFVIHEQELTRDGQVVAVFRWGKCSNRSALFREQAGAHLVIDDPCVPLGPLACLDDDACGIAFNWSNSSVEGSRSERDIEAFYRFPLFPNTDLSILYQSIFDPALTREIDHASAYSLRITSSY